jgi:hypothetical protein
MTGRFDSAWFLSSAASVVSPSRPECAAAPRAAAVKTGRRPPPKAAQSGLDGREHGASLDQAGRAAALLAADGAVQICGYSDIKVNSTAGGLPPRPIFPLTIGRKSEVAEPDVDPGLDTEIRNGYPPRSLAAEANDCFMARIPLGSHRIQGRSATSSPTKADSPRFV